MDTNEFYVANVGGGFFYETMFSYTEKLKHSANNLRKNLRLAFPSEKILIAVGEDKIEFNFDDDNFANVIYDSKQIFNIKKTKHNEMLNAIEKQIKILEKSLNIFDKDELFCTFSGIQFKTVLPFIESESDKVNYHFNEFFFNKEALSLFDNLKNDKTTFRIKHVTINADKTHSNETVISCTDGSFLIEFDNQMNFKNSNFNSDIFEKAKNFYKQSFSSFENNLVKPIAKKLADKNILDTEFLIKGTRE